MLKKVLTIFLGLFFLFFSQTPALAIVDPSTVANNKFGIHIFSEKDLKDAANLVNSSGGDWGYVTVVITEAERDHDRWQQAFDQMRRLHIIPIVRIATKGEGNVWLKPKMEEIDSWVNFLNSLNWVIQNRYITIGNEPNLDNEWGGKSNPAEYAKYLKDFSAKLKSASSDFFVLPAGLAPNSNEFNFLAAMKKENPAVFDSIDGWASHSYPSASTTLYKKELAAIAKDLPVFITETGWSLKDFSEDEIGNKLTDAYKNDWSDPKVVAVTPFILNYPQEPFGQYSWQKPNGTFYKFFESVRSIQKTKGEPVQIVKGEIVAAFAQPLIPVGSDFIGAILARNTGQSIWTYPGVMVGARENSMQIKSFSYDDIEPMKLGLIVFRAGIPEKNGIYGNSLFLETAKKDKLTGDFPIKGIVFKFDKVQIQGLFNSIAELFTKH